MSNSTFKFLQQRAFAHPLIGNKVELHAELATAVTPPWAIALSFNR